MDLALDRDVILFTSIDTLHLHLHSLG